MTILYARKILGTGSKNLSDEQMQDLLNQVYALAEIAVEQAILRGSNETHGVIDLDKRKGQNGNSRA